MLNLSTMLVQVNRSLLNALKDLRYGGLLIDRNNSDYSALSRIFINRIGVDDVLVDLGCGKGRVINFWLSLGLNNRILGIELDERIANNTRRRLQGFQNVTIVPGDVLQNIPPYATILYMFNPFDQIEQLKARLMEQFYPHSKIAIYYYNCIHVDVFMRDPAWQVEIIDLGGHSALPFSPCANIQLLSTK